MTRFLLTCAGSILTFTGATAQSWNGYGGNAQHSAVYYGASQAVSQIRWQTPLDDDRSYYGNEVLIHYASPMVTQANTVVYGYRSTTFNGGTANYDNWSVIARSGTKGTLVWQLSTDYSAAVIFPNDWTSVFPITLCKVGTGTGVAAAGTSGSILVRSSADSSASPVSRYVFYANLQSNGNYAPVKIDTPLTSDNAGNVYFGYEVTGTLSSNFASLGTGGVAKVNATTGQAVFQSVESLNVDSNLSIPAINATPALSNDGSSVYFALTGGNSVLVKLNTATMGLLAHVQLTDPSVNGGAYLISESSASPMVGPDGHVFMGVFGNQWRESHGWMLQFDGNLSQTGPNGRQYPVGSFGWDDTASVVPSYIVPSYTGKSSYLILTKYNNYDDNGGDPGADGSNKVAVIDPGSNSVSKDRQTGIPVMNEVLTVLGPTLTNDDPQHPNARREWCINSAAIDVNKQGAIINSEDGHMYRWSFITNSLTEVLNLQPATAEAYTSTAIGPDGSLYAINNAILFAVGNSVQAYAVSVYQGTTGKGSLQDIWYKDGLTYSTGSVTASAGQAAAIEADFMFPTTTINGLNVSAYASAAQGVTGFVYAYNYSTKSFVDIGSNSLGASESLVTGTTTTNGSQFIGPGGVVRIVVRGVLPSHVSQNPFTLAADLIQCGTK